jgi:hypothetical protein
MGVTPSGATNPQPRGVTPLGRGETPLEGGASDPPNRHKNRHSTESEPSVGDGDGPDTHTDEQMSSGKVCPIPPDWQPSARVFAWAAKLGLTRDWVEAQIEEFRLYWGDTGERRRSWDATFINRLQHVQSRQPKDPHHEPEQRLVDKDYTAGATGDQDLPDWAHPWCERADDAQ